MTKAKQKIKDQLQALSHEELQNVLLNYIEAKEPEALKDGGDPPVNCCPPGSCGVCVNGTCYKCA